MAGHLHAGNAARNGVEAGFLAQKGYTGRHGIIEIPGGFYNAYTATAEPVTPDVEERNLKALGNPWNILKPGLMCELPCAKSTGRLVNRRVYGNSFLRQRPQGVLA
jgi:hypothetical protein